ncbi:MAG: phosphodiesterase [Blautia sp.]|nr:phosphodiesterase [Blautia sp.]
MKWFIASDIHGSAKYCEGMMDAISRENPDRILLLGDYLYHGPRNDLPEGYAPKEVIPMLNSLKDRVTCVRGNCDCEVDQMVLEFPIMADYCLLEIGGKQIFATHGHVYSEDHLPPLGAGTILLCGHTHVPMCRVRTPFIYLNPGSISIPKEGSPRGYMTLEDGRFSWKNLAGEEWQAYKGC